VGLILVEERPSGLDDTELLLRVSLDPEGKATFRQSAFCQPQKTSILLELPSSRLHPNMTVDSRDSVAATHERD
jgi:hypothetical protein